MIMPTIDPIAIPIPADMVAIKSWYPGLKLVLDGFAYEKLFEFNSMILLYPVAKTPPMSP